MKILVVIPTYNRLEFLSQALESVIGQTLKANQIIVTGNVGPSKDYQDKCDFYLSKQSIGERVNKAVLCSNCDAFIVLCDDDLLRETYLENTAALMEQRGADIVYTDSQNFGLQTRAWTSLEWTKDIDNVNPIPITSLCKKSTWQRAGGYATIEMPYFDWHFWWKCFHSGATATHLNEPLFMYRNHGDQYSGRIDSEKALEQVKELMKK